MDNKIVDLRDSRFVLYEQLGVEGLCQAGRFQNVSREACEMILTAAEKLATDEFAPINNLGDKIGCVLEDGKVRVPEQFRSPFKKYCEAGWISMSEDYNVGGQNIPLSLSYACNELFFAANHSLAGYMGLTHTAAKVIEVFGTDAQKQRFMVPFYQGKYAGTMCLTEAEAGSDLSAIKTRAIRNPDGSYSIVGQKIFITGGEQDLTENIINIVLARMEGAPQGTRGLSCFIVPKIKVNKDGTLGENNDANCVEIEHKMGMKASSTCVLNFGDNGKCYGELLGPENKGITVAFTMMNEQRVLVGMQGLAQASTAFLHALDYARQRRQGAEFGKENSRQVPIIRHPDVRRSLLRMKAYTEGMRALILYTVYCMDRVSVSGEDDRKEWQDTLEVLTPICKAYCSDKGFDVCVWAVQVHGGYGYCRESKVEQFVRDCKATSLYEGTNGIQASDLFGRKVMRGGSAFDTLLLKMNETVQEAAKISELSRYAEEVDKAVSALRDITERLVAQTSQNPYLAYSWATPYLEICGDIVLGWMFIWQAKIAYDSFAQDGPDTAFYARKINTAKFYIASLLPAVYGKIEAVKKNDESLSHMDEFFS